MSLHLNRDILEIFLKYTKKTHKKNNNKSLETFSVWLDSGAFGRQGLREAFNSCQFSLNFMPLLRRRDPSSFTTGPLEPGIRTSRLQTQMWEKFLVLQLCLFGFWNAQARRHSVRSEISGTAAWWLMQLSKPWCWHGTAATIPWCQMLCQMDCSNPWKRRPVHILNHRGPSSWKNDMVLVWAEGSCHFLGAINPIVSFYSQCCPDFLSRGLVVFKD